MAAILANPGDPTPDVRVNVGPTSSNTRDDHISVFGSVPVGSKFLYVALVEVSCGAFGAEQFAGLARAERQWHLQGSRYSAQGLEEPE